MQDIADIINDLEKENKLIDIQNKHNAYANEASNIKLTLDLMHNDVDGDQRFRLEYCSIADANNNIHYYRFSIFSLDTIVSFNRSLRDMNNNERRIAHCSADGIFCIRESDLSEREINILKVIAKPEEFYNTRIDSFRYKYKHLKLFEYMEYMMAASLVKCLENAELTNVEINNLKNEIYRKKEESDEEILAEK